VNDDLNNTAVMNNSHDSIGNTSQINNSSSLTAKKDYSKIKAKSYLEALSLNLSKIVKENDQKYKALQEENNKMKHEYNSEMKDLLAKMNDKLENLKAGGVDDFGKGKNCKINGYSHLTNRDYTENKSEEESFENKAADYQQDDFEYEKSEDEKNEQADLNDFKLNEAVDVDENKMISKLKNEKENDKNKAFYAMENIYSGEHTNKLNENNLIKFQNAFECIDDDIFNSKSPDKSGKEKEKEINNKSKTKNSVCDSNKKSILKTSNNKINRNNIVVKSDDDKKETKSINVFMDYMKEILQKHINDDLVNGLSQNFKSYIDEQEGKLKEVFISQNIQENIKFNEEIVKIIRQIVKISEDNIKSFLKDIKSYIIEEFKEQIKISYPKDLLKEIEFKTNCQNENFTNFHFDISEIKKKIEALLENKDSFKQPNNIINNKSDSASEYNLKNLEENIGFLKIQTKEIEHYIKKIYEENIKEFINSNSNNNNNSKLQENENKNINFDDFQKEIINNIKEKIELKNNSISKYLEESIEDLKTIIKNNFEKSLEAIHETNIKLNTNEKQNGTVDSEENDKLCINVEKLTSNFMKNVVETFDDKIEEVKNFIDEKLEKQTKEISLKLSNDDIKCKNIEYKVNNDINLNEKETNLSNSNISISKNINDYQNKLESLIQKFESNISEEFETIKNDINLFSMNNKEIKSIITEEFGEITEVLRDLKINNTQLCQEENFSEEKKGEENNINSNIFDPKKKILDENFLEELLDKKINLIYERITNSISNNLSESNTNFKKSIEDEISASNISIRTSLDKNSSEILKLQESFTNLGSKLEKIDSLSDKIDYLQEGVTDEINNLSQNTQKTISFNQMDLLIKIKENFEELKTESDIKETAKQEELNKNPIINSNQYSTLITEESLTKNNESLKREIGSSLDSVFQREFACLDDKIESKLNQKLQDLFKLKWCNQCEKVDNNYAFTLCKICLNDNCKDCIKLCKICKTLNCKKCVLCPKCSDFSCINCRSDCFFCSAEKTEKFCRECLKSCFFCKKTTCTQCTRQCLNCSSVTCSECARLCLLCLKCSCRRCETVKNFKSCFHCKQTACNECVVECTECNLEVCNNCFNSCKNCSKLLCKKCGIDCENCGDIFCEKCAKDLNQNNCYMCQKLFCISCTKYLRKCKKCSGNACKNCCANCLKCKNVFCKNCNVNCDSCEDYACVLCVYKCSCQNLIFCEKCLFGVSPISPDMHSCVLWLNDSPVFSGIKTRSKISLPKNFEAKFYLEKFDSVSLLVGITDNSTFNEDTLSFIDNIWAFKPKTGQKYSSKKSLEDYYNKEAREKDFIIIAVKNDNLYFRVNFDDNPPAYQLPPHKEYYLYIENDSMLSSLKVKFIYLRKI